MYVRAPLPISILSFIVTTGEYKVNTNITNTYTYIRNIYANNMNNAV